MDGSNRVRGGLKYVKLGIHCVSLIFMITSALAITPGLYLQAKLAFIRTQCGENIFPEMFTIALGLLMIILGFAGTLGVFYGRIIFINGYALGLFFLVVVYIPVGSVALSKSADDYNNNSWVEDMWQALYSYPNTQESSKITEVQKKLQCCGLSYNGYQNWNSNRFFKCEEFNFSQKKCSVPTSCCKLYEREYEDPLCGAGVLNNTLSKIEIEGKIHTRGCINVVQEYLNNAFSVLGVLSFGTSFIALLGLMLTYELIKAHYEEESMVPWEQF